MASQLPELPLLPESVRHLHQLLFLLLLLHHHHRLNLGVGGTDVEYQTQIDTLLQAGAGAEKYPSIIAADNDVALHWTESEYTIPMADIGIGGAMYIRSNQIHPCPC